MRKNHVSHWLGDVPDDQVEKIPNSRHDGIYRRWLGMMDRCHNPKSKKPIRSGRFGWGNAGDAPMVFLIITAQPPKVKEFRNDPIRNQAI